MNAATRGVILAVVAVALGAFVLSQGFSDGETLVSASGGPATSDSDGDGSAEDAGDDSGIAEPTEEPAADDGAATDGDAGDDGDAAADGDGGDEAASDEATAGDDADDTGAAPEPESEVPDILHPANEVRVLVANGTTVSGAAGAANDNLVSDRGYGGLTPTNTTVAADASAIFYQEGYELDARQIAQILQLPEAVAAMPADPPVDDLLEAHVLVVIGPDFPGLG